MSRFFITFDDVTPFLASDKAENLLKAVGFSIGSHQRGAPTAAMFGDYVVAKWRNLNATERAETHAVIEGDTRNGPVRIRLLPACPDEAVAALNAAVPAKVAA